LSDRLPLAWLRLRTDDAQAPPEAPLAHEDRMALARHLLDGVEAGRLDPATTLWLVDLLLARQAPGVS
jgi:hypothetical protein